MALLGGYLTQVRQAIEGQDGAGLALLLALEGPRSGAAAAAEALRARANVTQLCERQFQAPTDEMMVSMCKALGEFAQQNHVAAYDALVSAGPHFLKLFKAADSPWVIDPLYTMVRNLHVLAERADAELQAQGKSIGKMSDAGSQLMKYFRESLQGAGHRGKKLVTLFIVNQLFKIYFKLNTLHLCKNLIKAVNSPQVTDFELFSAAQRVTYMFFVGRLAVFNDNYEEADEDLSYALTHCHKDATRNKRTILLYLVPVRLLRGHLPQPALLEANNLPEYVPLVQAMRQGNIRLLNETLDNHQEKLIRTGTYIILEKLKAAVYRSLFKKIHSIHKAEAPAAKAHQLPLEKLQQGLAWMGTAMDLDEVECVLVNLIYRKYLKGYISHKNRVLVLSKADAFPALKTVLLHDPT